MVWRFFLLVVLLSAAPSRGRSAEAADPLAGLAIPVPSVVMFWAAWCAPCRAEIAAWPELQRAAGPLPVHVVALDTPIERSRALLKDLPADRVHHGRGSSFSMLAAWSDRASGLPFAVVLDMQGRICASQNGGLTVERLAAMRRRCAITPPAAPPRRLDRPQSHDHNKGGN
jgi:thiol-disulfide isomerase/thioredoxin